MRPHRLPSRPLTAGLVALVVAVGVAGCGADTPTDTATVADVVDSSTVEVMQSDEVVSVRLVGLDSPTSDECLGAESARALSDLLPAGTELRLEVVEPATDDDAVVAALYAGDVLVNAELVRRGLAFADDDATTAIADAEQEAIDAAAGLFGTDVECTVLAQVADLEATATEAAVTVAAGVGLDEVDRRAALLATTAATGAALAALLDGDEARRYPDELVASLRSRTVTVNDRLGAATAAVQQVRVSEEQRIEAERVAAEAAAAQAAQAAADEAARQAKAAADAEAARVAAEAAAAKKQEAPAAIYYKNCDAVRAAGADPIYAGEPGYSGKLDRDGDGVACEK